MSGSEFGLQQKNAERVFNYPAQKRIWNDEFQSPLTSGGLPPIPASSARVPKLVYWTLILFVFTIPFEAAELLFAQRGVLSLARVAGVGFLACCFLYPARCLPYPNRALQWILVYFLICLFHGLFIPAPFLNAFARDLLFMAQFFIIFWLVAGLLKDEKCARSVLFSFSIAAVLMSLGALLGAPGFSAAVMERTTARLTVAEGSNPNYIAYVTGLSAVILVGFLLNNSKQSPWRKVSLIALLAPLFSVTVATGSRTGMAALFLGMSIYVLPVGRSRRKLTALLWGTLAAAAIVYLSLSNATSSSRWDITYASKSNARFEIWSLAIGVIADRPIFGWGPIMHEAELGRREGRKNRSPHNVLLYLFSEGGIVGGGVFLVGLWFCIWGAWRARSGLFGLMPLALVVTVIMNNLTHVWLLRRPTWIMLGFAIAATAIRPKRKYILRIIRSNQ